MGGRREADIRADMEFIFDLRRKEPQKPGHGAVDADSGFLCVFSALGEENQLTAQSIILPWSNVSSFRWYGSGWFG